MGFEDIAPEKNMLPLQVSKTQWHIFHFFLFFFFFLRANFCVPCLQSLREDVKYFCVDVTRFKTWTHIESHSQLILEEINVLYATYTSILGCVSISLFMSFANLAVNVRV